MTHLSLLGRHTEGINESFKIYINNPIMCNIFPLFHYPERERKSIMKPIRAEIKLRTFG